ncbi:MAG: hypothetical protein WC429_05800 [Verrucomicrobiia bacterium]
MKGLARAAPSAHTYDIADESTDHSRMCLMKSTRSFSSITGDAFAALLQAHDMLNTHTILKKAATARILAAVIWLAGLCATSFAAESRMSYLDNGVIRIGVDLNLGGAITWLSASGSGATNLVNSFDWGRQIQMSHYSGPVPYAPNGKQPNAAWTGIGWNPIQSGDCYGNRSHIVEHRNDGQELYVKCVPMHWPLNNEPGECTFECWLRLAGPVVQARCRFVNQRADTAQYAGRGQELPAIYTNGPWWRLMTYAGDRPFTGGPLTQIPAKMPWTHWQATENWAALVNDAGWGVGIWAPDVFQFSGGFAGKPGAGGPKDNPTGYIAPVLMEIIDHNITYQFRYELILGPVGDIRRYVSKQVAKPSPPRWQFERDRQHWHFVNATDTGWPIRGELKILVERNDPQLIGPAAFWLAVDAPKLFIEAACHTRHTMAQVFWSRQDAPGFAADRSLTFPIIGDDAYHRYEVTLSAAPEYRGAITRLRFDPIPVGSPGEYIRVKSISLR